MNNYSVQLKTAVPDYTYNENVSPSVQDEISRRITLNNKGSFCIKCNSDDSIYIINLNESDNKLNFIFDYEFPYDENKVTLISKEDYLLSYGIEKIGYISNNSFELFFNEAEKNVETDEEIHDFIAQSSGYVSIVIYPILYGNENKFIRNTIGDYSIFYKRVFNLTGVVIEKNINNNSLVLTCSEDFIKSSEYLFQLNINEIFAFNMSEGDTFEMELDDNCRFYNTEISNAYNSIVLVAEQKTV